MEQNLESLYKWIDSFTFSKTKKNIYRDFSDGVLVAEILKQHFPKCVDLHNYTAQNSYKKKLDNWTTLNRKVLKKFNINLTDAGMQHLAKAMPGEIEKLLFLIRAKIEQKKSLIHSQEMEKFNLNNSNSNDVSSIFFLDNLNNDEELAVLEIPVKDGNCKSNERIVVQKMVPLVYYDKLSQAMEENKMAMDILVQKVQHLENLCSIKDERIHDLMQQLDKQSSDGQRKKSFQENAAFLDSLF